MLLTTEAHTIAINFLREACVILGLDADSIHVDFIPMMKGNPVPFRLYSSGIEVADSFLMESLGKNSSTPIRYLMYCVAWKVYRPMSTPLEQATFAMALMLVKGISVLDEKQFHLISKESIIKVLLEIFHLDCEICSYMQKEEGIMRYQLLVRKDNNPHPHVSSSRPQSLSDYLPIGSFDNPFENVDQAAEYILRQEEKEWAKDEFMQDIVQGQYYYNPPYGPFRIGWASPFVAFYESEIPADGFVVNQLQSGRFSIKPYLYRRKFLYRGQSEYYEECYPNLFRDKKKDFFLDDLIWAQELQVLVASHPLVRFLEKGVDLLHDHFVFEVNYGGLTQHYYNKSSFLDLTSDIESAKFFAVTDYCATTDMYYPTRKTGLGVLYYYSLEMPDAFQWHDTYSLSTIGKQVFMRSGAQHGFLLRLEKGVNFNSLPQVRKVFFKHDAVISKRIFDASSEGKVYFPVDALEVACQQRLEVLKERRTVSMKAVELNCKRNPGETVNSIIDKLRKKDIKVDKDLQLTFPPESLSKASLSQLWELFCDKVYFYSPDGLLYQKAMKGQSEYLS